MFSRFASYVRPLVSGKSGQQLGLRALSRSWTSSSIPNSRSPLKADGKQKILCVLYEGGEAGRKNKNILGCVENALNLRPFLNEAKAEFVVTSDKDGPSSEFERNLEDATVVISQPFWPAYLTRERMEKAKKLKLAITAGIGSDHVDLEAACKKGITVAEITGSNVVSVAEHVVMQILILVRNFVPAYKQVINGEWDIAGCADRAWDLEGKKVGTVGAGRIGVRVLERLKPFGVELHYFDKQRLSPEKEKELSAKFHPDVESLVRECDVVTINTPLHPETEHLFNKDLISKMKDGSYLVNTARGKIVEVKALVDAVESGKIAGYSGDVWFPQPASRYHPWRMMPRHALTPHYSGTTLSAQKRYAEGVKEVLQNYFQGKSQREDFLIVDQGVLVSPAYTHGNATKGSEELAISNAKSKSSK